MTSRAISMPCAVCGGTITLSATADGEPTMSVDAFARDHARCLTQLAASGALSDTHAGRRRRLIRETVVRAHDGPHGILRTVSETEIEWLLDPILQLLEDAEERVAAAPRVIHLDEPARSLEDERSDERSSSA